MRTIKNKTSVNISTQRAFIFLLGWFLITTLMSVTIREYTHGDLPPNWDNLTYQVYGLVTAKSVLQGSLSQFLSLVGTNKPIGYVIALGFSDLLFGLNAHSPYLLSGVFGLFCLLGCFRLSVFFGASSSASILGVLLFACTPNFILQNFFQTRNDYALSACLTWAWILLLQSIKAPTFKRLFVCGVLFGIATLMKMSAPGYIFWGLLSYWIFPLFGKNRLDFWVRTKNLCVLSLGYFIACGWHFIPALPEVLNYHRIWSHQMGTWQKIQYSLVSRSDFLLFYVRNLFTIHMPSYWRAPLALFVIGLLLSLINKKARSNFVVWFRREEITLSGLVVFLSMTTLTLNRSLAAIGDIPILMIILSLAISLVSHTCRFSVPQSISNRSAIVAAIIPFLLIFGLMKVSAPRPSLANSFFEFYRVIDQSVTRFGLDPSMGIQAYSHPVYSADTFFWNNLRTSRVTQRYRSSMDFHLDIIEAGENAGKIAETLHDYQFLITARQPMIDHGGEIFSPLNRFQEDISRAALKTDNFVHIADLPLPNDQLYFDIYANKMFSKLELANPTSLLPDGWIVWGAQFSYTSFLPARLQIKGIPVREMRKLILRDSEGVIGLEARKNADGTVTYESEVVAATLDGKRTLTLVSPNSNDLTAASTEDSRHLALLHVEPNVIQVH